MHKRTREVKQRCDGESKDTTLGEQQQQLGRRRHAKRTKELGVVRLHLATSRGDQLLDVLRRDRRTVIVENEGGVGAEEIRLLVVRNSEGHSEWTKGNKARS